MSAAKTGEAAFNEAYASLNAAQKQAVDTIEGPVMVIAGPGTGKTQILTLRIANILQQTDAAPESILALTFTEAGARAMRARLISFIGDAAYRVPIHTFHGFAGELITRYPDAYPRIVGARIVSEVEQVAAILTILESATFRRLRPAGAPERFVRDILSAIATLKQEAITPDTFREHVTKQATALDALPRYHETGAHKGKERRPYLDAKKRLERNQELVVIYQQYEALLRAERLYDFPDMIVETIRALETNEEMLRDVEEQYQYVLADEHQDVNQSQNRLLELITGYHAQPNLFVVGDEKQAIYRFQGASLDNFLYFEDVFGSTTTIALTDNYRSGQPILDVAHGLIATDDPQLAPLRVSLQSAVSLPTEVVRRDFAHEAHEEAWLIEAVRAELEAGTPADEIAVIVRKNSQVEALAARLRGAGVPVAASAERDLMQHPTAHAVRALMEAVTTPSETTLLAVLGAGYWGIATPDLYRLLAARKYDRPLFALISDRSQLAQVGVADPEPIMRVHEVIESVRAEQEVRPPHRLLELLLTESGLLEHITRSDPAESALIVRRLYDEVTTLVAQRRVTTLADVAREFSRYAEHGIALSAPFVPVGTAAVQVLTAHKSKGLEFSVVFMPQLTEAVWSVRNRASLFDLPIVRHDVGASDVAEDDERRLFYVAMTRAKQRLHLSMARENAAGRGAIASRFLTALGTEQVAYTDVAPPPGFDPIAALTPPPPLPVGHELLWVSLQQRGLSATALNNYLKSPWQYLFKNVLRVPEIKSENLQYGTAMHATLEALVREHIAQGATPELDAAREYLTRALEREALGEMEAARLLARGLEALETYLPTLQATAGPQSRTEYTVTVDFATGVPELPVIPLTGNLDRLDFSESGELLRVVDYKTGAPKTRGQIAGTTKDGDGGYLRQLQFYALLLSLHPDSRFHCRTGVLSFIEPKDTGEVREESFTITDEDLATLQKEIRDLVAAVVSGACLTEPCDPARCDFCHLVPTAAPEQS